MPKFLEDKLKREYGANSSVKQELEEQKAALIAYLKSKTAAGDWHACADACMDLREIDAKRELLRELATEQDDTTMRRIG